MLARTKCQKGSIKVLKVPDKMSILSENLAYQAIFTLVNTRKNTFLEKFGLSSLLS